MIDTSNFSHILKVDTTTWTALTALVELNVPMDRLVAATIKHGLVPSVVMESPGITVGGGFAGTSGEIVTASETERSDLFHGAAGSFGMYIAWVSQHSFELQICNRSQNTRQTNLFYYPIQNQRL